jgi:hypothetical protein
MNDNLYKALMGRLVLVRSDQSGVWAGKLDGVNRPSDSDKGVDVVLLNAAKIHWWEGAAATSGLAVRGPGEGSRIAPDVEVAAVHGCCEVLLCTSQAADVIASFKRWEP